MSRLLVERTRKEDDMSSTADEKPTLLARNHRTGFRCDPRKDLRRFLDTSDEPLTRAQLAGVLGIPDPFVAYMLMDATRSGRITKLPDGRYESQMGRCGPALAELLEFVRECEASWRLCDRFGL
jgi:hypothetical protein